jgi:hypothetical protein
LSGLQCNAHIPLRFTGALPMLNLTRTHYDEVSGESITIQSDSVSEFEAATEAIVNQQKSLGSRIELTIGQGPSLETSEDCAGNYAAGTPQCGQSINQAADSATLHSGSGQPYQGYSHSIGGLPADQVADLERQKTEFHKRAIASAIAQPIPTDSRVCQSTMAWARGIAAQAWCEPSTSNHVFDHHLADAFADRLIATLESPEGLERSELYQNRMAGISTAALGYCREWDNVAPVYVTPALLDVMKLYSSYESRSKALDQTSEEVRQLRNCPPTPHSHEECQQLLAGLAAATDSNARLAGEVSGLKYALDRALVPIEAVQIDPIQQAADSFIARDEQREENSIQWHRQRHAELEQERDALAAKLKDYLEFHEQISATLMNAGSPSGIHMASWLATRLAYLKTLEEQNQVQQQNIEFYRNQSDNYSKQLVSAERGLGERDKIIKGQSKKVNELEMAQEKLNQKYQKLLNSK